MGYKKTALILILGMLLCACTNTSGQTEGTPDISGDTAGQGGAGVSDDYAGQMGSGETCVYAYSDKTVINAGNGGNLVYRAENGETIVGAAGSSDQLFVLAYGEDASDEGFLTDGSHSVSGNGFLLAGAELELTMPMAEEASLLSGDTALHMTAIRLSTGAEQEIDAFPSSVSGEMLGYYQGKLYMIYYIYEEDEGIRRRYAYCYEWQPDGGFVKSQDALCMTIMDLEDQGYLFCGSAQDLFAGLNAYDRLLVWKQEEAKVCAVAVDGSILWERQVDPRIVYIKGTDGRTLLAVGSTETTNESFYNAEERNYFIYDLEGTPDDGPGVKEGAYVWSDGSYLGVRDGYLYFYRYNKTAYNRNQYYFYRSDLSDPDAGEELLYETQDVAGQPRQREGNNGAAGFTVWKDACYFMDFDGKSLWWFACDLSDDAYQLTRLDVVDEYHGIFDAGEISYATDSYRCGDCGELVYEYYLEGIQLYGGDAVTDRINEALAEEMDETLKNLQERMQTYQSRGPAEDHVCGSYTFRVTLETVVNGTTRYRFRKEGQEGELYCLEVDYSGYDYTGGAHGYPWRSHSFFNLSDGSVTGMADLIGISEEEFRALAAEYTVADYLGENNALYFETEEDVLYETVYDYAGFDCDMYLGADGVTVEYFPYHLGPYGSGCIEVTVPYDKLGLELLEIYGVNE